MRGLLVLLKRRRAGMPRVEKGLFVWPMTFVATDDSSPGGPPAANANSQEAA